MRSLSPSGSTVLVADAEGNPVARSRYDPFGGVVATQLWSGGGWGDSTPQPLAQTDRLYLGDLLERNLNLYFTAGGRYYDPWLGKHLQPDPTGGPPLLPQAADRYQYAGNSPTGVGQVMGNMSSPILSLVGGEATQETISALVGRALERYAQRTGFFEVTANLRVMRRAGYADFFRRVAPPGRGRSARFISPLLREVDEGVYEVLGGAWQGRRIVGETLEEA
ncbi:MAG: RHS repeat-associated core domain-containing protein, partial [Chloroflexota bacterium]|nr:RHS repeat-associated core domain-containing protein [Chloroflexota bacterium]